MNSARPNIRKTDQNLHEAMGTVKFLRKTEGAKQYRPMMDGWDIASWIAITLAIGAFWYFAWTLLGAAK